MIKQGKFIKVKEVKSRPSVLSECQHKLLCKFIQCKDQSNGRMIPKEVTEAIIVLNPSLTINQDCNHYTNTFFVKYKDILTGKVKSQKTTTSQTGTTVAQQYIWNMKLIMHSSSCVPKTKIRFLMDVHFARSSNIL